MRNAVDRCRIQCLCPSRESPGRAAHARPHRPRWRARWRSSRQGDGDAARRAPCSKWAPDSAYFGVMPAHARRSAGAWAPSSSRSTRKTRPRPAVASRHHRAARSRRPARSLAVMDGRYITEARERPRYRRCRCRHLARPDAARRSAILGSGVQARSHLEAIRHVRAPRRRARLEPERRATAKRSYEMIAATGLRRCEASTTATRRRCAAPTSSSLATSSREPGHGGSDVARRHAHHGRGRLPARISVRCPRRSSPRAAVYVDSRSGRAARRPATVLIPHRRKRHQRRDTSPASSATWPAAAVAGRRRQDEVTMFKSLGMAVEDVVAARLAVDRAARASSRGQMFEVS